MQITDCTTLFREQQPEQKGHHDNCQREVNASANKGQFEPIVPPKLVLVLKDPSGRVYLFHAVMNGRT